MAEKLRAHFFLDVIIGLVVLCGLMIFAFFGKTNFAFLGLFLMVIGTFLLVKRIAR